MSNSRRQVSATSMIRTTQIKKQIAQRVSLRLKDKQRSMEIQQIQPSHLEHGITSQLKQELVKVKGVSKLAVPEQSSKPVSTPRPKALPIIAIHATPDSQCSKVSQHYHPHNVDRREKRKNERISKLTIMVKQKDVEIKNLKKALCKQEKEFKKLQHKLAVVTSEFSLVKQALTEASIEVTSLQNQHATALRKIEKLKKSQESTVADFMASEETIERLEEEKLELKEVLTEFQELKKCLERNSSSRKQVVVTKEGRVYAPVIRKLYYNLLSNQISAARAAEIVKAVLKCFLPDCDVESIKLPSESCAGYMRREELTTISTAHKVSVLFQQVSSGQKFHVNTDGTTKQQHKINSAAINGIVLSVNEVPDGTAESIINDIDSELEKLRNAAKELGIPNHMSINWSMFASATSDSASTQSKFNKLIEMRKEEDERKFGHSTGGMELITNFCAMHLGANLRKSFIGGMHKLSESDTDGDREHNQTDTFIHEFAKLFGQHGVREYCLGVLHLKDYIQLQLDQERDPEKTTYYQQCLSISFERQVGSRYFVSAANAGKILFMIPVAIEFLEYTGKDSRNELEKSVYAKSKS